MVLLQRQRYLIDYTLSALYRHKGKNLGLLLVYTLIVFLLASVMLFTQSLRQEAARTLQNAPEIIVQRMVAGRHALIPADYLEKMGRLRGVSERHGRLWGYFYDPVVKANYTLMAADHKQLGERDIAIGAGVARARGLEIGDRLSLRSSRGEPTSFRIREILHPDTELLSADLILLPSATFRSFFGIANNLFTDLALTVRNPAETRKIAEKLTLRLPDTRPILRKEILRTYDAIFNWRQGIVFVLLSSALMAFVIFAWDKASGLSAEEKREIGILKAIGWDSNDILAMKLWEGAVVSVTAFLLGYLLAYLHVFHASAELFSSVLKGWATLYPQFKPIPAIDGLQIATLFFFTVFPYTVATIIPVWRAAVSDPDTVMR
jgi:ABC-type lipoprotein release transport system permease subunit